VPFNTGPLFSPVPRQTERRSLKNCSPVCWFTSIPWPCCIAWDSSQISWADSSTEPLKIGAFGFWDGWAFQRFTRALFMDQT
jgi:hypothetical protein